MKKGRWRKGRKSNIKVILSLKAVSKVNQFDKLPLNYIGIKEIGDPSKPMLTLINSFQKIPKIINRK